VRLHFNEFYWSHLRQRIFNVGINGTTVLSDFDILGQAGGQNKAIVEELGRQLPVMDRSSSGSGRRAWMRRR